MRDEIKNYIAEKIFTIAFLLMPKSEIKLALKNLDPKVRKALEISISRIKKVHKNQIRTSKKTKVVTGGSVMQKWIPVDRVGLYVPGGKAVYPSSVIMNVIPAQIAKVPSIAIASPPQKENNGLPLNINLEIPEDRDFFITYSIEYLKNMTVRFNRRKHFLNSYTHKPSHRPSRTNRPQHHSRGWRGTLKGT